MISSKGNILSAMQRGAMIVREDGRYLLRADFIAKDKEVHRSAFASLHSEGLIERDWEFPDSEVYRIAAKPERFIVSFHGGDMRECELKDGVYEHVLNRGMRYAKDDKRIKLVKKVEE